MVEDADLVTVLPAPNTLSLVLREEGVNRFVKLISHDAPGPRVDVAVDYLLEPNDDDEEEEEVITDTESSEGDDGDDSDADVKLGAGFKRTMLAREEEEEGAQPTKRPKA